MPVQTAHGHFIQLIYNPNCLQSKKLSKTVSDTDSIFESIGISPKESNILVDVGNVM